MEQNQVNALCAKIRSDASPQIRGFLYQFVVALDYCFQLSPGQSLYIEKYGDIALKSDGVTDAECDDTSIEVKMYSDELNENHPNLLNTLYNWLDVNFDYKKYLTLIIYTTQPISSESSLLGWNEKAVEQRMKIITGTYENYLKRHKNEIEGNDSSKHKTIKRNISMMQSILGDEDDSSKERLRNLLSRVIIIDSCKNLEQSYMDLQKYTKVISEDQKEAFIHSLLGFIIYPNNMQNGWVIDYDTFTNKCQELAKGMMPEIDFPEAPDITVNEEEYADALFVYKLKQIDYKHVTSAISDFARTSFLLVNEFSRPTASKKLEEYQSEMKSTYDNMYENANDGLLLLNEVTEATIKSKSRIFFRNYLETCKDFYLEPYGKTKRYFSNGMCHHLANDEHDIKWILDYE